VPDPRTAKDRLVRSPVAQTLSLPSPHSLRRLFGSQKPIVPMSLGPADTSARATCAKIGVPGVDVMKLRIVIGFLLLPLFAMAQGASTLPP